MTNSATQDIVMGTTYTQQVCASCSLAEEGKKPMLSQEDELLPELHFYQSYLVGLVTMCSFLINKLAHAVQFLQISNMTPIPPSTPSNMPPPLKKVDVPASELSSLPKDIPMKAKSRGMFWKNFQRLGSICEGRKVGVGTSDEDKYRKKSEWTFTLN